VCGWEGVGAEVGVCVGQRGWGVRLASAWVKGGGSPRCGWEGEGVGAAGLRAAWGRRCLFGGVAGLLAAGDRWTNGWMGAPVGHWALT